MTNDQTLDPLDPQEMKDYSINWGTLLTAQSDTALSSSAWGSSVPPGLTVNSSTTSGTTAIVWVSGGSAGQTYGLTNHVVTSAGGRTLERTIFIPCRQL